MSNDVEKRKAGRPRKGDLPRVPICFSVDPSIARKAKELRVAGMELNAHIEATIASEYAWYFNK